MEYKVEYENYIFLINTNFHLKSRTIQVKNKDWPISTTNLVVEN